MRFFLLLLCLCSAAFAQTAKKTVPKTAPSLVEWKPVLPPPYAYRFFGPRKPTRAKFPPPPLPRLMVPHGTTNMARNKKVTSSDDFPIIGALSQITDGSKEAAEGNWVEIGPGTQWVQIDLEKPCHIYGVHIWHYYGEGRVYRDVIVQVADDEKFTKNVRTLFNNDDDDSSKLGQGKDDEYLEMREGFLIDTRGPKNLGKIARYVRLYSRGNTSDPQNQYIEVEVIGQPLPPPLPPLVEYRPELPLLPSQKAPPGIKVPPFPHIMAPKGAENLAYNRPVTTNNRALYGSLEQITDGQKDVWITLSQGSSWVQIDLTVPCKIYAIHLWHGFGAPYVYRDVVIQISNDRTFQQGVVTIFNNSRNKKSRFGIGPDKPYVESRNGLLIDTSAPNKSGVEGRYVRFWSNGNQIDNLNRYTEISVIGTTEYEEVEFVLPPAKYQ